MLSKYIYRIIGWIKVTFKIIVQIKVKGVFKILKKQVEDILKSRETSLVTTLAQINKKIFNSVSYLLSLCSKSLTDTNVLSLYQLERNKMVNFNYNKLILI